MLTSAGKIELLGKLTAASSTPGSGNVSIQYTGAAAADAISLGSGRGGRGQNDLCSGRGAGGGTFTGGTIGANRNATLLLASLDDSGPRATCASPVGSWH